MEIGVDFYTVSIWVEGRKVRSGQFNEGTTLPDDSDDSTCNVQVFEESMPNLKWVQTDYSSMFLGILRKKRNKRSVSALLLSYTAVLP